MGGAQPLAVPITESGGGGDSSQPAVEPLSFPELYRDNVAMLWRTLRRLGVRPADAEDACQDVFVVVHNKLDQFDWSRPMRPWLLGISVKIAAKYRRRVHVKRERLTDIPLAVTQPVGATGLELQQAKMLLERILAGLPSAQREVFVLFELQEVPMTEVAEIVEVPLQTAYSRLYAARKRVAAEARRFQKGLGEVSSNGN